MFLISCKDKRFVLSSQMLWRTFWIVLQNRDKMKKKNGREEGEKVVVVPI
jgi:hypothetical protein